MKWWGIFFIAQGSLLAQDPALQAQRTRAAMAASLERQREAVRRQEAAVRATPAGAQLASRGAPAVAAACDPLPVPELTRMISETSRRIGIDGGLVREVARQESGFRPCAVSPKGAQGLMQLMPATQTQFAVENPFDPQESIEAGSKLLKQLLDRYHGNLTLALSAYNAGAGCIDRAGGVPDIVETRNYVLNILSHADSFDSPDLQAFSQQTPLDLMAASIQAPGAEACQAQQGKR